MRRKISVRILASLMLSAMLLTMPVCAFMANEGNGIEVYAEESIEEDAAMGGEDTVAEDEPDSTAAEVVSEESEDESDRDADTEDISEDESEDSPDGEDSAEDDPTGDDSTEEDSAKEDPTEDDPGTEEPDSPEKSSTEESAECTCDDKCSEYKYDRNCPVCSKDYTGCTYRKPNVKITIDVPEGWYKAGTTVTVDFDAEDLLDTGNFAIQSFKAKIGQNGTYQDITEECALDVNENCTVYALVTDANDKSYERSKTVSCFDMTKPTLNAAVSEGLLTVQAVDNESGVKRIYVNGYEFKKLTNGTATIRLSQFDAGYEYFT